jgi:hypothetical protein
MCFEPPPGLLDKYCFTVCALSASYNYKLTNKTVTNLVYASNELKEISLNKNYFFLSQMLWRMSVKMNDIQMKYAFE